MATPPPLTWVMPAVNEGPDTYVTHRFPTVRAYEQSGCWKLVRDKWLLLHPYAWCDVCGGGGEISPITNLPTGLELHHLSYRDHLGFDAAWRPLDQLVPLCITCHNEVERRITAGAPRSTAHIAYRDDFAARRGGRLRHFGGERARWWPR